jgi:hypothetical protein
LVSGYIFTSFPTDIILDENILEFKKEENEVKLLEIPLEEKIDPVKEAPAGYF